MLTNVATLRAYYNMISNLAVRKSSPVGTLQLQPFEDGWAFGEIVEIFHDILFCHKF